MTHEKRLARLTVQLLPYVTQIYFRINTGNDALNCGKKRDEQMYFDYTVN